MSLVLDGTAGVTFPASQTPSMTAYQGGVLTSGTAVASTSGTSIDFTSIPSWVKRITVMFNGVSTNGTSPLMVQLITGSSAPTTSGYLGSANGYFDGSPSGSVHSAGFKVSSGNAASNLINGSMIISNVTGNTWAEMSLTSCSNTSNSALSSGSVPLAAALTGVRITTVNGTDTFDAGSINILYE